MTPPEQRFTFDDVGELYDRHRPSYPEAAFEVLVSECGLAPEDRILEIGAGTGQATRPLARRGYSLTSLEPGPRMAEIARRNLAAFERVEVRCETFEGWPLEPEAFGLVVSAQAFHWLSPELRFHKAARALRAEGALAVMGNVVVLERTAQSEAILAAYREHAPEISGPPVTRWYGGEGPVVGLFAESGCFGDVVSREFPWRQRYSRAGYLDLLRTHSDVRMLQEARRETLLGAIGEAIDAHGGTFEVAYEAHLHLASKRSV